MHLQIFNLSNHNPELYYNNLLKNLDVIKKNIDQKKRRRHRTSFCHSSSHSFNIIFKDKQMIIDKSNSVHNFSNKNVIKLLKIIKNDILKSLKPIVLKDEHIKILNYEKKNLEKFLFNEIIINKKYDDSFLKLFLLIHNKYYKNNEILYLLRFLLENCESDLFIKVLIYNYYLNSMYCDYGNCSSTLFSNKYYISNKKKFLNYTRPFNNEQEYYYKYNFKNTCRFSEIYICKSNYSNNFKFDFNNLCNCIFLDKFGKNSADCEYDEEYKKNSIYIKNYTKEKYIGKVKWVNENKLFKNTQIIFKNSPIKILKEYSPKKFNRQRLDIYFEINNKKIAFEYQGEQHYKCIEFFGGEDAFFKRKKLDKLKKARCKRNGIFLIEFKYNEDLSINSIVNKLEKNLIYLKKENICLDHLN